MTEVSESAETRKCARHGEYFHRTVEIAGRKMSMGCQACAREDAERNAERERKGKAEAEKRRIEALFNRSGIPPRFRARNFENYAATEPGQERALRVAKAYADGWTEMLERGTSLIFSGAPGTGKTHLACAIANAVMAKGDSALFTTVSEALRTIKRTYDKDADMSEADAIMALAEPRLLILDEIGADFGTEHSKTLLFDVINKRYENVRPTMILTNLDLPSLQTYLGERILDRLREGGGKLIVFDWKSHRS